MAIFFLTLIVAWFFPRWSGGEINLCSYDGKQTIYKKVVKVIPIGSSITHAVEVLNKNKFQYSICDSQNNKIENWEEYPIDEIAYIYARKKIYVLVGYQFYGIEMKIKNGTVIHILTETFGEGIF